MKTVSAITESIIKESPYLEEALSIGIVNLTALARKLKPRVEAINYKKTSSGAIVMALQRLSQKLKKKTFGKSRPILPQDLVLRSNITEYVFELSPTFSRLQKELVDYLKGQKDIYFTTAQGAREATVFVSESVAQKVEHLFKKEKVLFKLNKQCVIILRFSKNTINIPGVYYNILKALAWEGLPINEVISVGNEFTLVVESRYINRAFEIVRNLIKS